MSSYGDFAVTLDDIKRFRQLDSRTPGHPEYRQTAGVETTTGPLGQGIGNSVGYGDCLEMAGRDISIVPASRYSITTFTLSAAMAI